MQYAAERLEIFRTRWLPAVFETSKMYESSVKALEQFLNVALQKNQLHRAIFAEVLTRVDEDLKGDFQPPAPADTIEALKLVRQLRKELREIARDATQKITTESARAKTLTSTISLNLYWNSDRNDNHTTSSATGIQDALDAKYEPIRIEGYVYQSQQPGTVPLPPFLEPRLKR
ncbi:hypothetical protein WDW86_01175 [Bdellovibrionota bacterium FG-2]